MIKRLLMEGEQINSEINVDDLLGQHGITENHLLISLSFSKTEWPNQQMVREWAKDKDLSWIGIWNNDENNFNLIRYNEKQFSEVKEIELRPGLIGKVGLFLEETSIFSFSNKEHFSFELNDNMVKELSDSEVPSIIQVAKKIDGTHPAYGPISLNNEHFNKFLENYFNGVVGIDLAVNEDHKKEAAFGWYRDLFFIGDDQENLFAAIAWNKKGIQALANKEYRYFSPEFHYNWQHPHSGVFHGPTLLGGALTNYPFLKMDAIIPLNNKENLKGGNVETIELGEHKKIVGGLNDKVSNLETALSASDKTVKDLSEKIAKMEADQKEKERKAENEKLFNEGFISAAQLKLLNEGGNALDVLKLNGKMNNDPKGKGTEQADKELNDAEKAYAKSMHLDESDVI